MSIEKSPLAPQQYADLPPISGCKLASRAAGLKYIGRDDLLLISFDQPAQIAGVFTQSRCASAPVEWCKQHLSHGTARAVVVNAGNANAFTGVKGYDAAQKTAQLAAEALDIDEGQVFLASTGVIGEPMDMAPFSKALDEMVPDLVEDGWSRAASTIMTTDTYPKLAHAGAQIGTQTYKINAIAKGSGMIAPDMATMLGFIVTDAPIAAPALQAILLEATNSSFNSITVDSDTSTSDTVLAFATASSEDNDAFFDDANAVELTAFRDAFGEVMYDLARQIVRDGEGATKQVEIVVSGAQDHHSAKKVAMSIANSPLVKTAIAGEDANWGRVVMAVGKAGEPADRDKLSIWFGELRVAFNGERDPDYSEEDASAYMTNQDIKLCVDLGIGKGEASVLTCDLTHGYIAINGDYRS